MADLATFTAGVEEALRDAGRQPQWTPDDAEKYMAEYADRRRRFDELGTRLASTIIRPRLETLVGQFANASIEEEEPARRYSGWFGYCEKFPVSAKIELSVEHDVRFEKIVIHSATYMMPVFFRFNEQDNLPLSLDNDSDEQVTNWVEERMLEFLDDYLRIALWGTVSQTKIRQPTPSAACESAGREQPPLPISEDIRTTFVLRPAAPNSRGARPSMCGSKPCGEARGGIDSEYYETARHAS